MTGNFHAGKYQGKIRNEVQTPAQINPGTLKNFTIVRSGSRIGHYNSSKRSQQGCLPGSIRAEHNNNLTWLDCQGNVIQRPNLSVGFGDSIQLYAHENRLGERVGNGPYGERDVATDS